MPDQLFSLWRFRVRSGREAPCKLCSSGAAARCRLWSGRHRQRDTVAIVDCADVREKHGTGGERAAMTAPNYPLRTCLGIEGFPETASFRVGLQNRRREKSDQDTPGYKSQGVLTVSYRGSYTISPCCVCLHSLE